MEGLIKRTVEEWIAQVDYSKDDSYIPSDFALGFVNFIKLVNGDRGEENKTPVMHYKMLDQIPGLNRDTANMCSRGTAKSAMFAEYLFLYLAVYEDIPGFGQVSYALYVSDSIENGVKKMRKRIERRWQNSTFLQKYIPKTRFTDVRWEFTNISGSEFIVSGFGAQTGVRGTVELNTRPRLAVLDDLLSDADAKSKTVIASIEDTVYSAIDHALHPTKKKIIWSGTPFNAKDPLYKAIESGAWHVNVFPICETFPCDEKDFKGAWEDRFTYTAVKNSYTKALTAGRISSFNQELMLRIFSDEDRIILDSDVQWYDRASVIVNKGMFNFYITTDFATSEKSSADFSVISVWAYNNNGDWLWVDGICKKQLMDKNVDDLFRLCSMYRPQQVGIEVSGQQGGFIPWVQNEMITRNIYFNLASDSNANNPGIRPTTNKLQRFNTVVPMFKLKKIKFPQDMKNEPIIVEAMDELKLVSLEGMRSKHDDFLDTISMLMLLKPWKPSEETPMVKEKGSDIWAVEDAVKENNNLDSYIV